jgi:hypothetical protein
MTFVGPKTPGVAPGIRVATTAPSARKTTAPVGFPEGLVTFAVIVTGFSARAGLGKADNVTPGAEPLGCELLTKMLTGALSALLLTKTVLVARSNVPAKLAVRLLCRPAAENDVVSAAIP